jgi:phenylacetate-CoA ligase
MNGGSGGQQAQAYLDELKKSDFSSLPDLESIQNAKLKKLLAEVYENVSYYRNIMTRMHMVPSDIKSVEDLREFPILTKKLIRENHSDLINTRYKKGALKKVTTGGTTGMPMIFYFGKHELGVKSAHIERWKKVSGVNQFDRYMYMAYDAMAVNKPDYEGTLTHEGFYHMTSFGLNDEMMWRYYKNIKEYRPVYLRGVSSACYLLADFFLRNKINYPLKVVMTSSDMLYPYQRKVIEETFSCKVFDFYHQAEDVVIACECDCHDGLHVIMESCIPEIISENGSPLRDGQEGTIVGTQLENYSMPLIRYDTNDLGSISREKCQCGRSSIKIRSLDGRKADVIVTPEGKKIAGGMSRPMKTLYKEILEVQFIQKRIDSLIVRFVPTELYTPETEKIFELKIREHTGNQIKLIFEKVPRIEKTARGKHRFIISELNGI